MKITITIIFLILSGYVKAAQTLDLSQFANNYFNQMVATQMPNATEQDVDNYLALLADDVGHSHLPWDIDDTRYPTGKQDMKTGMMYYLNAHSEFNAELLNVFTFNSSAIAIRYIKTGKGVHPQTKQSIAFSRTFMEVLELEDGKVAVIRKYHQ